MDLPPDFPALIALPIISVPAGKSNDQAANLDAPHAYRYPDQIRRFAQSSRAAGAVCAPTAGGNPPTLAAAGLTDMTDVTREILTALSASLPAHVQIGGELTSCLFHSGQYDEECFDAALTAYRQQATALRDEKVAFFVFRAADDLAEVRTALIAARECCDLPFFATLYVDEDLRTSADNSALASLVTLQELGVAALGFCAKEPEDVLRALRRVAPYSDIPLIADFSLCEITTAQIYLAQIKKAVRIGADLVFYTPAAPVPIHELSAYMDLCRDEEEAAADGEELEQAEPYEFTAASHTDAFFFDLSVDFPPYISFDHFAAAVLEAENAGADLIRVDVANEDEADILLANAYMIRLPLCLYCEDPELLERIVRSYVGRLLIERPEIANLDDFLQFLCTKYGCILWG